MRIAAFSSPSTPASPEPLLDHRINHVRLLPGGDQFAQKAPDLVGALVGHAAGDDRGPAGRQLVDDADVEIAVEGERQRARDGRCGHHQHVGMRLAALFLHQLHALQHAEAVLLVDDDQAELVELHILFQQGVGADHQLGVALRDVPAGVALAVLLHGAGQQHDAVAGLFQDSPRRKVVLGRQNLRRRHHRHLVAVLHGDDGGFEGHDRLARAHVALQQPSHGRRLPHVVGNFLQHAFLGGGRMEWQDVFQRLADARVDAEADSRQAAHAAALQLQTQFEKEQLLEDETEVRRSARRLQRGKAFAGVGPVGTPEGLEARDQPEAAANRRRNRRREDWDRAPPAPSG